MEKIIDILGKFGLCGLIGPFVGIVVALWVHPATGAGIVVLVVTFALVGMIFCGILTKIFRYLASGSAAKQSTSIEKTANVQSPSAPSDHNRGDADRLPAQDD